MLTTAGRPAPRCYYMVWAAECSPVEEDEAEQLFCNYGAKTPETGVESESLVSKKKPSELLLGSLSKFLDHSSFFRHGLIWKF